jgi:hypothetical protein
LTVTSPALIIRATCEREYTGARRIDTNTSSRIRSCSAPAAIVVGKITSAIYRVDAQITASRVAESAVRSMALAERRRRQRAAGSSRWCWWRSRRRRWSSDSRTKCPALNKTSIRPKPSRTAQRLSSRESLSWVTSYSKRCGSGCAFSYAAIRSSCASVNAMSSRPSSRHFF